MLSDALNHAYLFELMEGASSEVPTTSLAVLSPASLFYALPKDADPAELDSEDAEVAESIRDRMALILKVDGEHFVLIDADGFDTEVVVPAAMVEEQFHFFMDLAALSEAVFDDQDEDEDEDEDEDDEDEDDEDDEDDGEVAEGQVDTGYVEGAPQIANLFAMTHELEVMASTGCQMLDQDTEWALEARQYGVPAPGVIFFALAPLDSCHRLFQAKPDGRVPVVDTGSDEPILTILDMTGSEEFEFWPFDALMHIAVQMDFEEEDAEDEDDDGPDEDDHDEQDEGEDGFADDYVPPPPGSKRIAK